MVRRIRSKNIPADKGGPVLSTLNLFSHRQIENDIYIVTENYLPGHRCVIGVICGAERVLVVDAGLGMAGDLRAYIERFAGTAKPMICVCTHGHSDCVGGAALFDEAYLSAADAETGRKSLDQSFTMMQLGMWTNHAKGLADHARAHLADVGGVRFIDLPKAGPFQLGGGVRADITPIPGHTAGSVALRAARDGARGVVFCGDAFSAELNHLHDMDRLALQAYAKRLTAFVSGIAPDEPVFSAHLPAPISRQAGFDLARACAEVAAGDIANDAPFDFGFKRAEGAAAPDLRVHLANNVYIVYNADLMQADPQTSVEKGV
jgi:glyoxylase-like metal-dependent hydrolase (beta-lactamase superfamily II)